MTTQREIIMSVSDYPWLRKWERRLHTPPERIDREVEQARAAGAPSNAIFCWPDGTWATTDDIGSPATRENMGLPPLPAVEPEVIDGFPVVNAIRLPRGWSGAERYMVLCFRHGHAEPWAIWDVRRHLVAGWEATNGHFLSDCRTAVERLKQRAVENGA